MRFRRATHLVVGFQHENAARRFWDAMRERLREFSLSLHPVKTRLIEFDRFAAHNCKKRGLAKPETFTFPGLRADLRNHAQRQISPSEEIPT